MTIKLDEILILIPVFNRRKYFEIFLSYFLRTNEIENVTYKIVDDCSTDFNIFEICKNLNIVNSNIIKNECNLGINYAFINLVNIANHFNKQYLIILDPDCIVDPNWLKYFIYTYNKSMKSLSNSMLSPFCRLHSTKEPIKCGELTLSENNEWPISNGALATLELQNKISKLCQEFTVEKDHFYNWEKAMTELFKNDDYNYLEPISHGYLYHFGKISSANFSHRFLSSKSTGVISEQFENQIRKELHLQNLNELHHIESPKLLGNNNRPYHQDILNSNQNDQ